MKRFSIILALLGLGAAAQTLVNPKQINPNLPVIVYSLTTTGAAGPTAIYFTKGIAPTNTIYTNPSTGVTITFDAVLYLDGTSGLLTVRHSNGTVTPIEP